MSEKCCCGTCKLSTGSSVALVFAGIEAILNLVFNAQLILLISGNEDVYPARYVININSIEDFDAVHGIVLAAIGSNAFWLAAAIFAVLGNLAESHGRLTPWIFLTYLLALFQFGVTIFFGVKFLDAFADSDDFFEDTVPTKTLTYLTLTAVYSGGGVLIFFNLFLAHIVERRGREIDQDYAALVLYVLSHMRTCSHMNDGMEQNLLPEAPPSYDEECPPYLPREIFQMANDSSGSSWSINCEAFKATAAQPNPASQSAASSSMRRHLLTTECRAAMTRNAAPCYQNLNIETSAQAALPY